MTIPPSPALPDAPSPAPLRARLAELVGARKDIVREQAKMEKELASLQEYLSVAEGVTEALEKLNRQLFEDMLRAIENSMSVALQEVLEQPLRFRAEAQWKRNAAHVEFWVERDGEVEDILKGQGGSVANVLSVGLRMFALTTLDSAEHRRFLVLDEQDCWLRPDLVPRLVKIVHEAGRALGFQTLMISHHSVESFAQYADRIYRVVPAAEGVRVERVDSAPSATDEM